MSTLKIEQIPALNDNYVYLVTCTQTNTTAVVDPCMASVVITALGKRKLDFVLNTHHHGDHTGGNKELKTHYNCTIIGSSYDKQRIPCIDKTVSDGDTIKIGNCQGQIIFTPGHTSGHIVFYFPESAALFCGDTLFAGGCGRLFEGTAEQMFNSLQKLRSLPDNTKVYCAHEYTYNNYLFAHKQAPNNKEIKRRFNEVKLLRDNNKPTVPSLISEEKQSNLFIMAENSVKLYELRKAKDIF